MGNYKDIDLGYKSMGDLFSDKIPDDSVRVGFFDGKAHKEADINIPSLAAVHEFGSDKRNIPERPFMRMTMANNDKELQNLSAKLYRSVLDKNLDGKAALSILGEKIKSLMQKFVRSGGNLTPKKNVKGKKSTPLINTGQLMSSVEVVVGRGDV